MGGQNLGDLNAECERRVGQKHLQEFQNELERIVRVLESYNDKNPL